MDRPSIHTDAYEDGAARSVPLVFLAGPIKHWWSCWGSPEHREYVRHRDGVRSTLIDAGYLTYAAWDALKGTWDDRAQAINDAAIKASGLVVEMTPRGIPAHGTNAEVGLARIYDIPTLWVPPGATRDGLLRCVQGCIGPGVTY